MGPSTETASCNLKECDIVRDVHCEFTVDNYIQQIFVDGVDITAKVSGNLHDWPSKKTYTFPSSARSFAARVNDAEAGCHNGGFAIKCSTQGTGGGAQWNMDSNQRQKWLVASSDSFGSTPPDAHGHHWYETDYPTTNGRWGMPRAGDTQYADSVIGVDDMCGPEHEASSHNKVGDCFACCATAIFRWAHLLHHHSAVSHDLNSSARTQTHTRARAHTHSRKWWFRFHIEY